MHILSNKFSCFNSQHVFGLVLLIQGTRAMIYILTTWIFIAHFEFVVNINISSLSAAKSAYGSNEQATVRGIIQPSTWHVGVVLFHCFMQRLFPFHWQYQSYTTLCICAWVRLRIFSLSLQFLLSSLCLFSAILSFFSSVSVPSCLSLTQSVPSSFYPPCFSLFSSTYLSLSFVIIYTLYLFLRHGATSRKFAGSISDGVIGIFHWHNLSGRTMTQPLTEMGPGNISLGGG
jgi:hypothetical protein